MDSQNPETKPIIIAMKGHPGTGKSTLSHSLAKALKFPLIDKTQFRDSTKKIQDSLTQSTPAITATALLNDLSYEAMWRVAATQLAVGLSVIVDSPLSKRTHLDRLIELEACFHARLAVVECRPKDEAEWRRRIEARATADTASWHKPSTWQEMERLLEKYGGCWDYDFGDVPKLTVDTTANVEVQDLVSSVIEFVHSCHDFLGLEDKTGNDKCRINTQNTTSL